MKTKACVFWLVVLLLIILVPSAIAQTPLSGQGPFTINISGDYVLQNDIYGSSLTKVIDIKVSDVTLDGAGHTIDGVGGTNTGINVWSGTAAKNINNIVVKNIQVSKFKYGFIIKDVNNVILLNNIINGSYTNSLFIQNISNSKFYNNKFNNSVGLSINNVSATWNVPSQPGPNIVGGPSIGGNYWGNPSGTGFSDTATDANHDGFADTSYTIASGKIDYLPLVKSSGPPPIFANFTATPLKADVPFDFTLTDLSTGQSINYWCWTVSNTSNSQKFEFQTPPAPFPVHISVPGLYSINLMVSDGVQTNTKSRPNYINATAPPVLPLLANFSADTTIGHASMVVHFTDLTQGNPTGWHWNFGDGTLPVDDIQNPDHTYDVPGVYTVTLTAVKAEVGIPPVINHSVKRDYIFVKAPMPVASFDMSRSSGELPLSVVFNDTSQGEVVHVHWDFNDGGWMDRDYWWWWQGPNMGTPDPNWMTVEHTYYRTGTYHVNLTVWNSWGESSFVIQDVVVERPSVSTIYFIPQFSYLELDANKPQFINVQLALSPQDEQRGFSGYSMDLFTSTLDGYGRSEFTSMTFPDWAVMRERVSPPLLDTASPSPIIALKTADLNNMVQPGRWQIPLAVTSVNGMEPGLVRVNVDGLKLNDEAGNLLSVNVIPGQVYVYAMVQPFPGMYYLPTDPDQDHFYEDVNGNTAMDYADVVMYFQQMENIPNFETIKYFDYNQNGRIDFADVIMLFHEQ